MSGEETQAKGADGARRARNWLDATTRVNVQWVNPEPVAIPKLSFHWENHKEPFSFDLGGILLGGELQGQEFLAECKKYATASDQGKHYIKYLAQCYQALKSRPDRCDNFMWITWSPFNVTEWDQQMTPLKVRSSVLDYRKFLFGEDDKNVAGDLISDELCKDVADRLWMIVLSDRQETLTLTREHLGVIRRYDTEKRV
ncbi:hypothetical protein GCM10022221_51830 [Actinocorallia aurea]